MLAFHQVFLLSILVGLSDPLLELRIELVFTRYPGGPGSLHGLVRWPSRQPRPSVADLRRRDAIAKCQNLSSPTTRSIIVCDESEQH